MAQVYKSAQLSYTEMFDADELIVEFDGVTYTLANHGDGTYGAGNNTTSINPIGIKYANGINTMYIHHDLDSGDHHVVIKSKSSSIETTECFKKAVQSVSSMMLNLVYDVATDTSTIKGATWQEAYDVLANGAMIYLNHDGDILPCVSYSDEDIGFSYTVVGDAVYTHMYIWQPNGSVIYDNASYPPQQGNA